MKYEEALKELENILAQLESDKVGLDEAVALFEKSVGLSKICFDKIKQTEGKVEIIRKDLDEIKIKPFEDIDKKD